MQVSEEGQYLSSCCVSSTLLKGHEHLLIVRAAIEALLAALLPALEVCSAHRSHVQAVQTLKHLLDLKLQQTASAQSLCAASD